MADRRRRRAVPGRSPVNYENVPTYGAVSLFDSEDEPPSRGWAEPWQVTGRPVVILRANGESSWMSCDDAKRLGAMLISAANGVRTFSLLDWTIPGAPPETLPCQDHYHCRHRESYKGYHAPCVTHRMACAELGAITTLAACPRCGETWVVGVAVEVIAASHTEPKQPCPCCTSSVRCEDASCRCCGG